MLAASLKDNAEATVFIRVRTCLFRPFFTTKPEIEGSGLGLYLTRELVRKNNGRISVSSFPASGTTFTLEFPVSFAKELAGR